MKIAKEVHILTIQTNDKPHDPTHTHTQKTFLLSSSFKNGLYRSYLPFLCRVKTPQTHIPLLPRTSRRCSLPWPWWRWRRRSSLVRSSGEDRADTPSSCRTCSRLSERSLRSPRTPEEPERDAGWCPLLGHRVFHWQRSQELAGIPAVIYLRHDSSTACP